jgi:hypothetical protein
MTKKNLVILVVLVILIIIASAGYYVFSLQKNTKQNPTNNSATDIEQNLLLDKEKADSLGFPKPMSESSPEYQEIYKNVIGNDTNMNLLLYKVVGDFAIGGKEGNGGGGFQAIFAKINGEWKVVVGTQDEWPCKNLVSAGVTPTVFAELENQKTDNYALCFDYTTDSAGKEIGGGSFKVYKDYYQAKIKN